VLLDRTPQAGLVREVVDDEPVRDAGTLGDLADGGVRRTAGGRPGPDAKS